jgi:ABC-type transport system involved in cytochrome bd biosynthesis fused ATPase/permease subunit
VLLAPASLVLLDEPTAGLDDDAEGDVVAAIRRLADAGSAVVVVAHRPSLVAGADLVVLLDAVQVGT